MIKLSRERNVQMQDEADPDPLLETLESWVLLGLRSLDPLDLFNLFTAPSAQEWRPTHPRCRGIFVKIYHKNSFRKKNSNGIMHVFFAYNTITIFLIEITTNKRFISYDNPLNYSLKYGITGEFGNFGSKVSSYCWKSAFNRVKWSWKPVDY
jgi:hypothetical protein